MGLKTIPVCCPYCNGKIKWDNDDFYCWGEATGNDAFYGQKDRYSTIVLYDVKKSITIDFLNNTTMIIDGDGKRYTLPFIDDTINYSDISPNYIDRLLSLKAFY
jgi:hypothetical protein